MFGYKTKHFFFKEVISRNVIFICRVCMRVYLIYKFSNPYNLEKSFRYRLKFVTLVKQSRFFIRDDFLEN